MDVLDDMRVSKLSAKDFLKVNKSFKCRFHMAAFIGRCNNFGFL